MKKSAYVRFSITIFLLLSMLSPTAVLAKGDGKKLFKEGLKHEYAEEWDKAVEKFALAIIDNPRNPEYRLHYQRAIFNASQMFMKEGRTLAENKDYAGAYVAFRKAYGYDPVNELAKSEMERMVRLQKEVNGDVPKDKTDANGVKLVPTSYNGVNIPKGFVIPQQLEKLRDVPFPNPVDLQWLIKELAKDLDLNVLFDTGTFGRGPAAQRKVSIELKNVTAAKALDYLFLQENLFFQKVGPRTILVANGDQRQKFQQLVLRTFYLANASPKDVANVVKTAIPAQPGRTPTIVLTDDATNSITIRDTTENIRLIGKLIASLDKDRAEVVMDVQIFEVSKTDLLELGNQIGTRASLTNLGGTTSGVVGLGGNDVFSTVGRAVEDYLPTAIGAGIILPGASLRAFQEKTNTKLLASTQIHAFNNEDSSARIGQRVPVRTASFAPVTGGNTGNNNSNVFGDVYNYEQTGLTLKFKPLVFPNQDVQVTMEIESKDVAGAITDQPIFTERTIKGTARVQNNKTLLLASVAQNNETNGRAGIPLLGLIPIIGRLFSAPTKDNRQVDIVIAVTPRVIRAPSILPEDLEERETGSLAVPTTSSLEAMVILEEVEEQLAAARRLGNNAKVQLPDQPLDAPQYVKSDASTTNAKVENKTENTGTQTEAIKGNTLVNVSENKDEKPAEPRIEKIDSKPEPVQPKTTTEENTVPVDSEVKTLEIKPMAENQQTVETPLNTDNPIKNLALKETSLKTNFVDEIKTEPFTLPANPVAELQFLPGVSEMKAGEKTKLAVIIRSSKAFNSAVIGLAFDETKLAVKTVELGDVFGEANVRKPALPFINQSGKMYVTLSVPNDTGDNKSGVLAYIEIEALMDGKHELSFEKEALNLTSATGENFAVKF